MTIYEKKSALWVGVDVHKDTHTAVGISPFGERLFELTIGNYPEDFAQLADRIAETGEEAKLSPYVGLEDCAGYGARIAAHLSAVYPTVHVPPVKADRARKRNTHPEKSDSLDALSVAKVMMHDIDTLPAYTVSEQGENAKLLKELSRDRAFLVSERTRLKNQLHMLLHRMYNSAYRTYFPDPFSEKALRYWMRVRSDTHPYLVRMIKRKVRRLREVCRDMHALEEDMDTIMTEAGYTLTTASGCGVVLAAAIIGEIGDINRFDSPAALAKYAGCAPREHSSGKTKRHRKTQSGNRRLNSALYRMALSQISPMGTQAARRYVKRKQTEGKSKAQALVCLRRQMANVVYMMLKHQTAYRCPQ